MLTPKMLMAAANRLFQKQKGELSFASRNFGRGAETARNDCRTNPALLRPWPDNVNPAPWRR
jgi:hypothetical protein